MPKSERKTERKPKQQKKTKQTKSKLSQPKLVKQHAVRRPIIVRKRILPPSVPKLLQHGQRPRSTITPPRFVGEVHTRTLTNGSTLSVGLQEAPSAVSALDMDRHLSLESSPNGNLKVRFCLPLCDVTSSQYNYELGAALNANSALNDTVVSASTLLLNPMVMIAVKYGNVSPQYAMTVPSSPHVGLQALSFSRFRVNDLGFAYQPQGQTMQQSTDLLAESRLRFCYTSDPTHPVLGYNSYRGTGTIEYSLMNETPNSVQFAEWNPWTLKIRDHPKEWLFINYPRFVPGDAPFSNDTYTMLRQNFFGACSLFDADSSSATRVIMPHGQLWMSGEFEFSDPSPLLYNYVPPQISRIPGEIHDKIHGEDSLSYNFRKLKVQPKQDAKTESKSETKEIDDEKLAYLKAYAHELTEALSQKAPEVKYYEKDKDGKLVEMKHFPDDSKAYTTRTNGNTTTLHVSPDDDEPEMVTPPRFGTPVSVPGSSEYLPKSTPSSQKQAVVKHATSPLKSKKK